MLPDIKFQANFTEKPLAGKQRASDDAVMLDVNIDGGVGNNLVPEQYDHITLTYNVGNYLIGVIYRTGGGSGTIVASLSLTYDGANNLISVARV